MFVEFPREAAMFGEENQYMLGEYGSADVYVVGLVHRFESSHFDLSLSLTVRVPQTSKSALLVRPVVKEDATHETVTLPVSSHQKIVFALPLPSVAILIIVGLVLGYCWRRNDMVISRRLVFQQHTNETHTNETSS